MAELCEPAGLGAESHTWRKRVNVEQDTLVDDLHEFEMQWLRQVHRDEALPYTAFYTGHIRFEYRPGRGEMKRYWLVLK